jgi:hypothetical protein
MRRATKGTFDLMPAFQRLSEEIEKLEPVGSDEPNRLDAQMRLIQMAKKIILFVFGMAYEMHGKGLREEQELIGIMSDMIIEVYANESVLLRSQKMLNGKKPEKATISVIMTKVLFHDSLERIGFLATRALEAMEDGELLERHIKMIRRLMVSPPINTVTLRRDIADEMIRYGRYFF